MNKHAVPALAAAALAGSALGQGMTTDQVRLELRLVSQTGTLGVAINSFRPADSTHPDQSSGLGVARRFEVQFRLVDLDINDQYRPAGLVSGNLRIVAAAGGTLERARLSRFEANSPSGAPNPPVTQPVNLDIDTSSAAQNGASGVHRPLRGGILPPPTDTPQVANGIYEPPVNPTIIRGITPLALSQNDQHFPTDPGGGWYGAYSFNFLPTALAGRVDISFDADATSGNRFGFFNDGDPVPLTSPVATSDSANIMADPSPSAFALLGMNGMIVRRRRQRAASEATG